MGLITTFFDGKAWDIRYSQSPQDGFYYTNSKEDIAQNCQAFGIDMDNDENIMSPHYLKEFHSFFVYTSQAGGKRYQYIILDSASEGDIIEFAQKRPKQIAHQIYKRLGLE